MYEVCTDWRRFINRIFNMNLLSGGSNGSSAAGSVDVTTQQYTCLHNTTIHEM